MSKINSIQISTLIFSFFLLTSLRQNDKIRFFLFRDFSFSRKFFESAFIALCGNFKKIQPFRFYVKSIFLIPEVQNLQTWFHVKEVQNKCQISALLHYRNCKKIKWNQHNYCTKLHCKLSNWQCNLDFWFHGILL